MNGELRNRRQLTGEEIGLLADRMIQAKSEEESAAILEEIIRGFYGTEGLGAHRRLRVRVEKISESENPAVPAGDPETYQHGLVNTTSLPIGYFLEGYTDGPPVVGDVWKVERFSRNGVTLPGNFASSIVVSVGVGVFSTLNSCYEWSVVRGTLKDLINEGRRDL